MFNFLLSFDERYTWWQWWQQLNILCPWHIFSISHQSLWERSINRDKMSPLSPAIIHEIISMNWSHVLVQHRNYVLLYKSLIRGLLKYIRNMDLASCVEHIWDRPGIRVIRYRYMVPTFVPIVNLLAADWKGAHILPCYYIASSTYASRKIMSRWSYTDSNAYFPSRKIHKRINEALNFQANISESLLQTPVTCGARKWDLMNRMTPSFFLATAVACNYFCVPEGWRPQPVWVTMLWWKHKSSWPVWWDCRAGDGKQR